MQQVRDQSFKKNQKIVSTLEKHYNKGRNKEARRFATQLLSGLQVSSSQLLQAGVAAYNSNDTTISLQLCKRALELGSPDQPHYINIKIALGLSLTAQGQYDSAIEEYSYALSLQPKNVDVLFYRGLTFSKLTKFDNAVMDLKAAFSVKPESSDILFHLAINLQKSGKIQDALDLLQNTLPYHENNPDIHIAIGKIKKDIKASEALPHFRKAIHLKPDNASYLNAFLDIFEKLGNMLTYEGLDQDLLILLSNENVQWKKLQRTIPSHLKSKPAFQGVAPIIKKAVEENTDLSIDFGTTTKILADNVFLASLKRVRIIDPELEKLLETFRHQALVAIANDLKFTTELRTILLAIVIPLAQYCFANEYVLVESEAEKSAIQKIANDLSKTKINANDTNFLKFAIACCYQQPFMTPSLVELAKKWDKSTNNELNTLIKVTVIDPLQERKLQSTIPQRTPISDAISLTVQQQYEENPYPRWQHIPRTGSTSIAINLANTLPILEKKIPDLPSSPQILIAGCGTGQQPISTALSYPETQLLAVDLSLASIAYAKRKTQELGINNIEYGQADIMELRSLKQKFDVIECGGVLHHMSDPLAGWKILVDLLNDDGFMLIGLYSELGRQDIVAARKYIAENGFSGNLDDIRRCRKEIISLEDTHLAKKVIKHGDFYATSSCRDLIFHEQEHRFTIPQLEQSLKELNLEFLGFTLASKYIEEKYSQAFPDDKNMTCLKNWAEFEISFPEAFSTMYTFWVRKKRM